jgi:uncharacterized protein YdaL
MKLLTSAVAGALAAGLAGVPASAAAPPITSVTPANKATAVPVAAHPTATFSTAVNPADLRYSFVKSTGNTAIPSYYRYDAPSKTVTFIPRAPLGYLTKYTITIKTSAQSSAYTWSFTTGSTDTTAPSQPGTLVADTPTTTTVGLSWDAATDNVGVTEYVISSGSTVLMSTTATNATVTNLTPSTGYSFTVTAKDAAGNTSTPSNTVSVTTATPAPVQDTTPPTAPGAPTVGTVTATTAALSWAASTDAVGVVSYQVTGGPTVVTSATASTTLTSLTPSTTYAVRVTAYDAAGNASVASAPASFTTSPAQLAGSRSGAGIPGSTGKTLVVYDSTGPYAFLGEQYALVTAQLTSHFGAWTAQPAVDYAAGDMAGFDAVVYIGSTYDEPLPLSFLDDVTATTKPVFWMYGNIWQLTARDPNFATKRGFTWTGFDFSTVPSITYKGASFPRDPLNAAGIMNTTITDPAKAQSMGEAVRADGTTFSWGVKSGNFTYLGEIPYAYMTMDDRYVAFCSALMEVLAPATAARHRAMVRLEDVGPDATPSELRAITNYLSGKGIPFMVAVYPRYRDPLGANNNGVAEDYTLAQRPQVVTELKYMQSHGGTLLMHGYTHQYSNVANPYQGVSADDFEFYRAHVDAENNVVYDGPVAEDSQGWAQGRINDSFTAFTAAGLGRPTVFELPHYAGSDAANRAIADTFQVRYDRGLYPAGALRGTTLDNTRIIGQFFPWTVRDIYGVLVIPENIGNIELEAFNNHPPRLPADIVASAQRNLVIPDGVASFFFHPYNPVTYLQQTVEGIQAAGYTFVSASSTVQ